MSLRRTPLIAALSASLAAGGVAGALLFTPAVSGAQTAETPTTEAPADSGATAEGSDEATEHDGEGCKGPRGRHGKHLAGVAEVLGVEADAIREALQGGQTLAEFAEANGVSTEALIDALVAARTSDIDEKVASGDLDAEKAAEIKDGLVEKVTAMVNGERPERPEGFDGRRRGPRFGPGGPSPDADAEATPTADLA